MAISKWLNILAFHLLEVWTHSSFPTSFLIRSHQSQSFSVWPCGSDLLAQALSYVGMDQGLIQITWQGQSRFMRRGRGRGGFPRSSTSWFVFLSAFRNTTPVVPRERKGLRLGWQNTGWSTGISVPGAHRAQLPSENGQPVTVGHLLIQSMAWCTHPVPTSNQLQWESGSKAHSYIQAPPAARSSILAGRAILTQEGGKISLPVIQPISVKGHPGSNLSV